MYHDHNFRYSGETDYLPQLVVLNEEVFGEKISNHCPLHNTRANDNVGSPFVDVSPDSTADETAAVSNFWG